VSDALSRRDEAAMKETQSPKELEQGTTLALSSPIPN
jgi:hypothetical protein